MIYHSDHGLVNTRGIGEFTRDSQREIRRENATPKRMDPEKMSHAYDSLLTHATHATIETRDLNCFFRFSFGISFAIRLILVTRTLLHNY